MKKFLLPLLVLALSATAASAQAGPPQDGGGRSQRSPEEMAARQTEGLTRQLGLSADQAARVQPILLARDQEMMAMRGQMQAGTADRSQLRDQMLAGRAKYDDQLKAVLTPDQFTRMQAMQTNRRERGRDMATPQEGKVKAKDGKVKIKTKTDA